MYWEILNNNIKMKRYEKDIKNISWDCQPNGGEDTKEIHQIEIY